MLRTFNCGVGFCIIINKKILKKSKNILVKNSCLMKLVMCLREVKKKINFLILLNGKKKDLYFYFWIWFKFKIFNK